MVSTEAPKSGLSTARVVFFAAVVGIFIFNVFASQVLVTSISMGVGLSVAHGNLIPALTALGYALGLLFIVPLADIVENRRLVVTMAVTCMLALVATALARDPLLFLVGCFVSGAASSLIQILVPLVGSLTPAAHRGRVLGNVMSGLMVGIMLSRPLASLLGEHFGWRAVYLFAAAMVAVVLLPLKLVLPEREPVSHVGYGATVASLVTLFRREPILRSNAITAALVMGAFNVFWTAIASRLASPPFQLSARGIALFGLVGTAGAISAPIMGRLGDRGGTRVGSLLADASVIAAFLLALVAGGASSSTSPVLGVAGLVAAAILLDFGAVGDQTLGRRAINLLEASAIGRRNGLFVGIFFVGGAVGSAAVGPAFAVAGWSGVCVVGGAFGLAALLVSGTFARVSPTPTPTPTPSPPASDGVELARAARVDATWFMPRWYSPCSRAAVGDRNSSPDGRGPFADGMSRCAWGRPRRASCRSSTPRSPGSSRYVEGTSRSTPRGGTGRAPGAR